MIVTAALQMKLTVVEQPDSGAPFVNTATGNNQLTHDKLNISLPGLSPTSVGPAFPVSKFVGVQLPMVAGALTIDLTNLIGTNGITVSGATKKVRAILLMNDSNNTHDFVIGKGASNGYSTVAAGTAWSIPLSPGQAFELWAADKATVIDSTHKNIDVAGNTTEVVDLVLVMG